MPTVIRRTAQFLPNGLRSLASLPLRLRPPLSRAMSSSTPANTDATLADADATQAAFMEEESIIQVDEKDRIIGPVSKLAAHLVKNGLPLHRAFSVFLFDTNNRLLIQQRASTKITYPDHWANTCCSHPLHNPHELGAPSPPSSPAPAPVPSTSTSTSTSTSPAGGGSSSTTTTTNRSPFVPLPHVEQKPARDSSLGVRRAAVRKLEHELGIPRGAIPESSLHFMIRVHYRSVCGDGVWGEHEMDYVLFGLVEEGTIRVAPAPNEVREARWVTEAQLRTMFLQAKNARDRVPSQLAPAERRQEVLLSPWFQIIMDKYGWTWWEQLQSSGKNGVLALSYADKILPGGEV